MAVVEYNVANNTLFLRETSEVVGIFGVCAKRFFTIDIFTRENGFFYGFVMVNVWCAYVYSVDRWIKNKIVLIIGSYLNAVFLGDRARFFKCRSTNASYLRVIGEGRIKIFKIINFLDCILVDKIIIRLSCFY